MTKSLQERIGSIKKTYPEQTYTIGVLDELASKLKIAEDGLKRISGFTIPAINAFSEEAEIAKQTLMLLQK